jgi:hypothetical protein
LKPAIALENCPISGSMIATAIFHQVEAIP